MANVEDDEDPVQEDDGIRGVVAVTPVELFPAGLVCKAVGDCVATCDAVVCSGFGWRGNCALPAIKQVTFQSP